MTTGSMPAAASGRAKAIGAYGETVAARHLTAQGMVVLDRNWSCPEGEIDLVLRDGDTLVVCEVKTRTSLRCGSPLEAVDQEKFARLRRLGAAWVGAAGLRVRDIRVDAVGVLQSGRGAAAVEHVRGLC